MKAGLAKKSLIRVAVVESDPLRFVGLRALLDPEQDFELTSVSMAEIANHQDIDVALVRDHVGGSLFEIMDSVRDVQPGWRVVVTGLDVDDETILNALAAGAKGYINEAAPAAEFALAIRVVQQGLVWAPRRVLSMFIDRANNISRTFLPRRMTLTVREKQVLKMLVGGRSNKEIAAPLGIEERTVKAHVAKLMCKAGVPNRIALSVHAITHALVPAE
jgi:DNA-binding NarL/FixJ family response regulator